jgi:methylmalonyl-CoA/ethylmalonyl-CoA epimerase
MKIEKIDHICFAVKNLDQAVKTYEEKLDLIPDLTYVDENEKIRVARYYIGDVAIELMESTAPDGEVAKFIRRRGEGFYLISFKVDDVEKELEELMGKGRKLIDEKPRRLNGLRFAFLEPPQKMLGTLIEIIDGELTLEVDA